MKEEMDHEETREGFEEKVFAAYYISGIKKNSTLPMLAMVSTHNLTKAEFCKRTDGTTPQEYVREEVDAMWFGWKLAMKYVEEGGTK